MRRKIAAGIALFLAAGIVFPGVQVKADTTNVSGITDAAETVDTEETADTAETVVYDAADFETFRNRTKEEVGRRYGEALYAGDSYINYDTSTYYENAYSLADPYDAGKLTEDTHKIMTAMTQFYRWLVGVEPLKESSVHSDKLQAEALVRNFEFNHTISDSSKPEDMTQEFWDYGAKDYLHTILARYSTPRNSITSWMNEGYSPRYEMWDTVGHRYALIGATVSDVQFGYAGSIAVGQEKAYENKMENPFSAYPAPGYMPSELVHCSSSAWSIEINRGCLSIDDSSKVVVKVTDVGTSESYECTMANRKLRLYGYYALSFVQPDPPVSGNRYTGSYQVEVTGLTDVNSSKAASLTYTVDFFDPTDYTPSYVKTVTADGIEKFIVYQSSATTEYLEKIAYALPSEVTVIAENGRRAQVPVTGKWILDEEQQCWSNEADKTKLPADITDREGVLDKCVIHYEISESIYDAYNSLTIYPSSTNVGDSVSMEVYLSQLSADSSAIFQLIPQEDGSYKGIKRYDSRTSEEFEKTSNGDHIYNIKAVQKSDEGEYLSIFYASSDTCAYVCTGIRKLTVQDTEQSGGDDQQGTGNQGNQGGQGNQGSQGNQGDTGSSGNTGDIETTENEEDEKEEQEIEGVSDVYKKKTTDAPFILKAKSAGSGEIVYSCDSKNVVNVGRTSGKVTITGAGTAKIVITVKETATHKAATRTITIKVSKASQKIKTKTIKKRYAKSTLKKGKKTFNIGAKASGKLTYKVTKGKKYISVSKKGKVTVKKGTPKGTYKITVTAAATAKYSQQKKIVMVVVE